MLRRNLAVAVLLLLAVCNALTAAELVTSGPGLHIDVSPDGTRLAMDLRGDIWLLPIKGGEASLLVSDEHVLSAPRWSPDGNRILYSLQGANGAEPWIIDLASGETRRIGEGHMQDASWHAGGDTIVFSAERHDTGLDLWEIDVPTGLSWRLTSDPGDETEPVFSANGRHLAWIRHDGDGYALMLRRRGQAPVALVSADARIGAPAWRPDGSLLTYEIETEAGMALEMAILSEPVLIRRIDMREALLPGRVSWAGRMTMVYPAGDGIRKRGFDDHRSRQLRFRAVVEPPEPPQQTAIARRELAVVDVPDGRLVVRAARLFDGVWRGYRDNLDVVIKAGRIEAIEPRRDRDNGENGDDGEVVIDLGNVTIIPGLVDTLSASPSRASDGPAVLAYGVTTIAVEGESLPFDPSPWESESLPGPRVLLTGEGELAGATVSVADSGTPGMAALLASRQALALGDGQTIGRRFSRAADFAPAGQRVVIGSRPNGLPPGLALQAELRGLAGAGLTGEQVLHAAGRNSAILLGAEHQVGTLIEGAVADLVLVRGDPLANVADALNVVAVVRNGRFFSLVRLLEIASDTRNVE